MNITYSNATVGDYFDTKRESFFQRIKRNRSNVIKVQENPISIEKTINYLNNSNKFPNINKESQSNSVVFLKKK